MSAAREFDVFIAGGGLVGGSLALALAGTGCRVGLAEAVVPDSDAQPSFDDRSIALSRGSCRILRQLGLWPALEQSVWPVHRIHVSERGAFGTAVIDAAEQGVDELGYVIRGRDLGLALWQRLADCGDVTLMSPARVTAAELEQGWRRIDIEAEAGPVSFATRLLAIADGAHSRLRGAVGIEAGVRDYDQVAIVANLQVDAAHAGSMAYERFTQDGPLAVLPGKDGLYTVVLARGRAAAEALLQCDDAQMLALVQREIGFRLGRLSRIGKRSSYPLQLVTANVLLADRAVVVGNSAHGLHPVAGQGFNLGLRDVACLAELVADAVRDPAGGDAGAQPMLDAYAAWRAADQRNVVRFTDGLIRGFGLPGKPLAVTRGLALAAFDILPGGKQELARQTMGLAGRLSRLARGMQV